MDHQSGDAYITDVSEKFAFDTPLPIFYHALLHSSQRYEHKDIIYLNPVQRRKQSCDMCVINILLLSLHRNILRIPLSMAVESVV